MASRTWLACILTAQLAWGCSDMTAMPPGSTPLANAVVHQRPDIVAQLLAAGAPPDSADERGTSALLLATATDQFVIANLLLDHKANIWATDKLGYTAAIYAYTSHVPDDSPDGEARRKLIARLQTAGYPWPPPWPDDVKAMREAGQWPPQRRT